MLCVRCDARYVLFQNVSAGRTFEETNACALTLTHMLTFVSHKYTLLPFLEDEEEEITPRI